MFFKNEVLDLFNNIYEEENFATMNIPDIMRTDIYEIDGNILLEVELPGYSNTDISADLKNGYLTIMAKKVNRLEAQEEKRNYLKRERHIGGCKRSYYIGEDVSQESVQAAFKHGVLKILINIPNNGIEDRCKQIEDRCKQIETKSS